MDIVGESIGAIMMIVLSSRGGAFKQVRWRDSGVGHLSSQLMTAPRHLRGY